MSRSLVVHHKRKTYLVQATEETRPLAGCERQVEVQEKANGAIEIQYQGRSLAFAVYDKQPLIPQGELVESKRLSTVLAAIQVFGLMNGISRSDRPARRRKKS